MSLWGVPVAPIAETYGDEPGESTGVTQKNYGDNNVRCIDGVSIGDQESLRDFEQVGLIGHFAEQARQIVWVNGLGKVIVEPVLQ